MEKGERTQQNDYEDPNARMTTEQDFLISADCQVGNYDPERYFKTRLKIASVLTRPRRVNNKSVSRLGQD
jgi:hypothetical protein